MKKIALYKCLIIGIVGFGLASGPGKAEIIYAPNVTVETFAGTGNPVIADGPLGEASFQAVSQIAQLESGDIVLADHTTVRLIRDGRVSTPLTFGGSTVKGLGVHGNYIFITTGGGVNRFEETETGEWKFSRVLMSGDHLAPISTNQAWGARIMEVLFTTFSPRSSTITIGSSMGDTDGAGGVGKFRYISDIAAAQSGSGLYVGDNMRVRFVTTNRVVTTISGQLEGGFADGPKESAMFRHWLYVSDSERGVLVGDSFNHAVRLVAPDGSTVTLAGDGTAGYENGPGSSAKFNRPTKAFGLKDGNVLVADNQNYRLRLIRFAPSDVPELTFTSISPVRLTLSNGVIGRSYAIESTTELTSNSTWVEVDRFVLTESSRAWMHENLAAGDSTRFYRAVALP